MDMNMQEQLLVFGEVLGNDVNNEWGYAFRTKMHVGRNTYIVTVEKKPDRLELNALFPKVLDSVDLFFWQERLKRLNRDAACGEYVVNDAGGICYRVYSLFSRPDEVKDEAAIRALLEKCETALRTQAEPMLAPGKLGRVIERLRERRRSAGDKGENAVREA